jgi:hypothetical protein
MKVSFLRKNALLQKSEAVIELFIKQKVLLATLTLLSENFITAQTAGICKIKVK